MLQANLEKPETTSLATESDCNKLKIPLVRVVALSSLGKARLREKATGDALRLFGQAIAEADKIKEDQDRLQAKLMLVQLFLDVNSSSGFERAAEVFKADQSVCGFQHEPILFRGKSYDLWVEK